MDVTEEECRWALAIRLAAAADPRIPDADSLTDFEYVQHAIVAKDNVGKALKRIVKMQEFKERYGIKLDGSVDEAARDLRAIDLQHPGLMMCLASCKNNEGASPNDEAKVDPSSHVVCVNFAQFLAKRMKTAESHAIVMRFFFYVMQACACNAASIRAGIYWLSQSDGIGLRNFSRESEDRRADFASHTYPLRFKLFVMLSAPWVARVLFQVIRVFMSPKMASRFHLTGGNNKIQSDYLKEKVGLPATALPTLFGGTLDDKEGGESMTQAILSKLEERYENMDTFRLKNVDGESSDTASSSEYTT